jgi:putative membrane protein insertion efficiency factor
LKPTTSLPLRGAAGHPEADPHVRHGVATVVVAMHRAYKVLISPLFTGSCRFEPSCADYVRDAVITHGVVRGGWLGLRRLSRCLPLGGHGLDPVPPSIFPHRP